MTPLRSWILVTTLTCTLPSHDAYIAPRLKPAVCAESQIPLTDLSRFEFWGAPQNGPVRLIASWSVAGKEGQRISFVFDDQGIVWTVWVRTTDVLGNRSCASNQIGVNIGPGIPDPSAPPPERP